MVDFAVVDAWWAQWLGIPVDALLTGGVAPGDHVDHVGLLQLDRGSGVLAYGPDAYLDGLDPSGLEGPGRLDEALAAVQQHLGRRLEQVLGPAWYGYAGAATLPRPEHPEVRRLQADDAELLEDLRAAVSPMEWAEAGLTEGADFGWVQDSRLLAAASLGRWRDMPSVGVLTHPRWRSHGLGRSVVQEATRHALIERPFVQYRAWTTNEASIALGQRSGFWSYGRGVVVDVARDERRVSP